MQENKEKLYGVQDCKLEEIHKTNRLGYSMLKHMLEEHTVEDPLGIVALLPEHATESYTVLLDNIFIKVNSLYELYKMFVFSYVSIYIYMHNSNIYSTSVYSTGVHSNNIHSNSMHSNNIQDSTGNYAGNYKGNYTGNYSTGNYRSKYQLAKNNKQKTEYMLEEIKKIKSNILKSNIHSTNMHVVYTCNQITNMLSSTSLSVLQQYILVPDDFVYATCKLLQRMYPTTACRKKYVPEKNAVVTAYITGIAIVDSVAGSRRIASRRRMVT